VLATPGHTPEHVSFLAEDLTDNTRPAVLFSGGSLLVGAVSRTDLLGHEHTLGLTHQLYHSLHEKLLPLGDDVAVYPTHGAGSFCTAAPDAGRQTTIGQERRSNALLAHETPEAFARALLESMPTYPTYFHHMRALNQRGPRVLGDLPRLAPLDAGEVQARQARGEAVVDLRPVADYAAGHIPGVYHVEMRPAFGSWAGWVVPFGTPVILVAAADDPQVYEAAVRQLIRVGYDDLPGHLAGGMAAWQRAGLPVTSVPLLTMREVRTRLARGEPLVVLDARQPHEWPAGRIPQARLVEAGSTPTAALDLPLDGPIAVHCAHGMRAATAISALERRGYRDLALIGEGVDEWRGAGGQVVSGPVPAAVEATV
jgi:rhodanese-related sulfurtransferase